MITTIKQSNAIIGSNHYRKALGGHLFRLEVDDFKGDAGYVLFLAKFPTL